MESIYLTDQVAGHPDIKSISKEIMFSVAEFYDAPDKAQDYRASFTREHRLAEDSGGFQFLMGKMPLEKCDPLKTVEIYKRIGVTRKDFPIQLDLPPKYSLSKEERMALIIKGAEFYHAMASEIDWVVPVIHGWTVEELLTSLELIENPEKVAAGTFSGTQYDWVMGKLNSHKPRAYAAGSSDGGHTYMLDHLQKTVAVGSWNISQVPKLKFSGGKDPKVVGAGAMQQSGRFVLDETGWNKKTMATPGCAAEQFVQRTPQKVVWERLALVLNLFRDRELFMLGSASSHDQHLIFLGGAKYGDTSSWRLKAYLGEIYIPEVGSVAIGKEATVRRPDRKDLMMLRECLKDASHPLTGMTLERFLTIGAMHMKEWKDSWIGNKWEVKPFDLRALHNAWVLKAREEVIAREFANDPDRYYKYLHDKRFNGHPNLLRKLNFLWSRFKRPYVQSNVDMFLKRA